MLAGDIRAAEEHFMAADRLVYTEEPDDDHLFSRWGAWWAEFLASTGRLGPARKLAERIRDSGATYDSKTDVVHGWNTDVARSDRVLGHLDLAVEDTTVAGQRLAAAAVTFRDGDYLVELAATLPAAAACAQVVGELDTASRHVEEALAITGPRGLAPSQAAALAVRARICADLVTAGSPEQLARGRDAAHAAYRIATRHGLAWQELDALDAHARLDQIEGVDYGWTQRAVALRAQLQPTDLDPDPLSTVERLGAQEPTHNVDDAAE